MVGRPTMALLELLQLFPALARTPFPPSAVNAGLQHFQCFAAFFVRDLQSLHMVPVLRPWRCGRTRGRSSRLGSPAAFSRSQEIAVQEGIK